MLSCAAEILLIARTLDSTLIQSLRARLNCATGHSRGKASACRLYGLACFACAGHLAFQS